MKIPKILANRVRDIGSADCVFCPQGTALRPGDWVYVHDERPRSRRRQRLMEVTAVKLFQANGQAATLDNALVAVEELLHIAADSELSVEALLEHHGGNYDYESQRPPAVVYFRPCEEHADMLGGLPDQAFV
jgi:pyruvate formate-lyase activating enzyme-like uncharacterized protein